MQSESRVAAACKILREGGVKAEQVATRGPGTGGQQAREAIAGGCDAVFACGGDGTVHDVLQGMVGNSAGAALGIIPLGTANALANDIGIPRETKAAARMAITAERRTVPVGRIEFASRSGETAWRYFIIAVGIGADAILMYKMTFDFKQKYGMNAYYMEAARLFFTHKFAPFEVVVATENGERRDVVWQMLAVRITDFGGMLRHWAPGAALSRDDMQVLLVRTAGRLPYFLYVLRVLLNRRWTVPGVELLHTKAVQCRVPLSSNGSTGNGPGARILVEADGEALGTLPVTISMTHGDSVTLLAPPKGKNRN